MSKKAEMYAHIASWKTSGLQQKAYCPLHSIKLSTFHYCKQSAIPIYYASNS
ncbi:hypothetical protein MY04_06570 [Flammeovirga sp. MY04]|uniref:IS66 family insertion sequence element accessory protein TnpA n=1 Tax=Flammeovirga sp. MY04 TaxID=1191459 RepID=UPI0013051B66|nr:hypothetical protein [Flammeovirga sp. MY04]QJD09426.1 hypothetical protein MY04_06570 [Flammeovirga sp. MY04]